MFKDDEQTGLPKRLSRNEIQKKKQRKQKQEENIRPGKDQEKNQPQISKEAGYSGRTIRNKTTIPASSTDDLSSNASEITAPSPKQIIIKWTPPQTTQTEKTPSKATKNLLKTDS